MRASTLRLLLPLALIMAFGLQLFRLWTAGLFYYLYETARAGAATLFVVAIVVWSGAFLAGLIRRRLGTRALWIIGSSVTVIRIVEQINVSPAFDLLLTSLGVIVWWWFIASTFETLRATHLDQHFPTALLLGLSVDTVLKGAFGTIDLSWVPGVLPVLIVVGLAGLAVGLLRAVPRPDKAGGPNTSWLLIAFGPFLFLQVQLFQNIGLQAALTGWPLPFSFELIILANALGLIVTSLVYGRLPSRAWTWTVMIVLILIVVSLPLESDPLAALELFAGQIVASIGLAIISQARGRAPTSVVFGAAFIMLTLLVVGYYVSHIVRLPVPYWFFVTVAALMLGVAMIMTVRQFREPHAAGRVEWTPGLMGLGLMAVPLIALLLWHEPGAVPGQYPVRVMSYNLHSGFDVQGRMGLEAIAQTIESEHADVIALQEVSRGWVFDTSADMLAWLSQRLQLPYVWGPTADPMWGNAILSRYPVEQVQLHAMPNNDVVRPARGFVEATINLGGQRLRVITTHLHHVETDAALREPQVQALLAAWAQQPHTIILGDLNSQPNSGEMQTMRAAGLLDAFISSRTVGEGFTFRSDDLKRRIDYVYHAPDLIAQDLHVNPSQASDHAALAVTLAAK